MDCNKAESRIIYFLEGGILEKEVLEMEKHFASCESCAAKKAYLEVHLHQTDVYKTGEVKPFLYTRIKAKTQAVQRRQRILVPFFYTAVLAIGLIFGTLISQLVMSPPSTVTHQNFEVAYLFNDMNLESTEYKLLNN